MAKRRKRKTKWSNFLFKRGRIRWLNLVVLVLIIALAGYGVDQLHQLRERQMIVQKQSNSKKLFIKQIAPESQVMMREHNVPASITMAQAILESDWGSSTLAAKYYNLFGVKSSSVTNSQVLDTKEYENGSWIVIHGRFQVYSSWSASIDAHTMLMVNGTTDDQSKYANVIKATNYKDAAQALQQAGYATDPDYASKLIQVIQTYHLDKYDENN
ncbi:N-acetylmuramidase [Paucilactobacillus hokkaidonensis JCM 18461]|uniref:N-acetylmuramidase n=1 Tax=Paucilactobacillus hokkaidonensis JCM 18461 TaxID=1291742 RepID=A0A0A1GXJ5_9LACO|nr:glycoside hydrolase family 73 protein [Paucilactobacillus hokkaidonensis]BAP85171.1 N-acetylmuramidase [Paucilactobacillus hokkaidonensis JCM 18461]